MIEGLKSLLSSRIQRPILQFVDGTILTNSRFLKKIYDGYGFSVSHRFESIVTDSIAEVYFENPAGSSRDIYIVIVEVISTGQGWCDVFRDNTVTAAGTAMTPINLNLGSSVTSIVSTEYGGTYTAGTQVHNTVVPGGSAIRAIGGATEIGESVIIPENNNILVRVTNKSTSAEDISIRIIWWEDVI
jgi:hypothetical protein